jgi:hypothetical protein
MLCNINNDWVRSVWHKEFFDASKSRLSIEEYSSLIKELNKIIQKSIEKKSDIVVSSFIPGRDWSDTVWDVIHSKACGYDEEHSAQFFGLLVCQVLIERNETWMFIKQDVAKGMIYFRDKKTSDFDSLKKRFS